MNVITDGQTQHGSGGGIGGVFSGGSRGGYFSKFSKRLKIVLMTFKMLNEAYFVILYQKELENSDILGKIPFFMKISKISKSKLPKKCLFYTKSPVFRLFLMKYHKIYLFPFVFLQFCMIFDEKGGSFEPTPGGVFCQIFDLRGGYSDNTPPPLAISECNY